MCVCVCVVQKLSALSASLARVVSTVEEEEAEMDHFPAEGVRDDSSTVKAGSVQGCANVTVVGICV